MSLRVPVVEFDLVVDALQRAAIDNRNPVIAEDIDGQRALGRSGVDAHDLLLRETELHRDRLQLGDDNETGEVGAVDDVALIDLTQPGPTRQRRNDLGIAKGRLRVIYRRLVGIHKRLLLGDNGALRIGLLLGAGVGSGQLLIADQIQPHIGKLRLILRLFGDRLIELRLVDHRIDFAENITLTDVLSFGEIDCDQFAVDLGAHCYGVQCPDGADAIQINRNVLDTRCRRQHRHRQIGARPVRRLLLLKRVPRDVTEASHDQQRNRDRNGSAARARSDAGHAFAGNLGGFVQFRLKEHRPASPSSAPNRLPAPGTS